MRKELIIALATVLTSTMVTIPVQAATPAEGDAAAGAIKGRPSEIEYGCAVGFENEEDPGDITEDKILMDAFGGVDKYNASFERITPEYFKQKYGEVAESLKDKIDTTTADTIITSATSAVNNHFTSGWGELGLVSYYAFDQRMYTDYLATGRCFNGYEPAVLLHTILDSQEIENDIWFAENDSVTVYVAIPMTDCTRYVAFSGPEMLIYDTVPTGLYTDRFADMYMGAYKDFID